MERLIFFILGCLFSRYILYILDYILEWFYSWVTLKINILNAQSNKLASQESQNNSLESIGFVIPDDYDEDE